MSEVAVAEREATTETPEAVIEAKPDGEPTGGVRYRWRCACGDFGKRWHKSGTAGRGAGAAAGRARAGGDIHAVMNRGTTEWAL